PVRRLARSAAESPGRACARRAAAPAADAAATLVPVTDVYTGAPSAVDGSEVAIPTPGAETCGASSPPKVSPREENAVPSPASTLVWVVTRPTATWTRFRRRTAATAGATVRAGMPRTGTEAAVSEPGGNARP